MPRKGPVPTLIRSRGVRDSVITILLFLSFCNGYRERSCGVRHVYLYQDGRLLSKMPHVAGPAEADHHNIVIGTPGGKRVRRTGSGRPLLFSANERWRRGRRARLPPCSAFVGAILACLGKVRERSRIINSTGSPMAVRGRDGTGA